MLMFATLRMRTSERRTRHFNLSRQMNFQLRFTSHNFRNEHIPIYIIFFLDFDVNKKNIDFELQAADCEMLIISC